MRCLMIVLDGIDEASALRQRIQSFVIDQLVPRRIRLVVTSRPEGVEKKHFLESFVIVNLKPLSDEQQRKAIGIQLKGLEFSDHLMAFGAIRREHDRIFVHEAFPDDNDRRMLETMNYPDGFFFVDESSGKTEPNKQMRQHALDGSRVVRPVSQRGRPRIWCTRMRATPCHHDTDRNKSFPLPSRKAHTRRLSLSPAVRTHAPSSTAVGR